MYNQEHVEIGLGYAMTRKAIDDNLYKTQFHPSNLGLIESFQQTKEIYGANVLNTATAYNRPSAATARRSARSITRLTAASSATRRRCRSILANRPCSTP